LRRIAPIADVWLQVPARAGSKLRTVCLSLRVARMPLLLRDHHVGTPSVRELYAVWVFERCRVPNTVAESTIGTIKAELLRGIVPNNIHQVQCILFPYVKGFYDQKQLHLALGYITPAEAKLLATESKIVA
jgi:transposase InsO family protein